MFEQVLDVLFLLACAAFLTLCLAWVIHSFLEWFD